MNEHFAQEWGTIPGLVKAGSSSAATKKTPTSALAEDVESGGYGATSGQTLTRNKSLSAGEKEECQELRITDCMAYRAQTLTTWEVFTVTNKTVWVSRELWVMMLHLGVASAVVAMLTILVVGDPERLKVGRFMQISKFLNVIVGLLLGFFLSSSMQRWHMTVNGFLVVLDSIRNLQMQFVALGLPVADTQKCLRWAFASAWLLYGSLLCETQSLESDAQKREKRDTMWTRLSMKVFHYDSTETSKLLTDREISVLRQTRDPPGMMWFWVAALIGRLAQDGWLPPMASPTYGRILTIAESAHGGIREVRQNISVQAPLTYTHMLASLVHINNLINAVSMGLVSGLALGTAMMAHDVHPYTRRDASGREATQDYQSMFVTFMYCFFGPLLYQALLLIAMHLAQPFDSVDAMIPLDRLLHQLEVDMCNGRDVIDNLDFEPPTYKPLPHHVTPK